MDHKYLVAYLEEMYENTLGKRIVLEICNIYIIAEALLDVETRNRCVRALYNAMSKPDKDGKYYFPYMEWVRMIYESAGSASNPMRRLLVDAWYDHAREHWFKDFEAAPKEFLWDIALKGMSRSKNKKLPIEYNMDEYMEMVDKKGGERANV